MAALQLSEIWHYPVKSMRGTRCATARVGPRGLAYDRHWMLVDTQGRFITQRQLPQMALIKAQWANAVLSFQTTRGHHYTVRPASRPQSIQVTIWRDQCAALLVDATADQWLGDMLGKACHLVQMPDDALRQVDQHYAQPTDQVGFADGFPFLLIAQASLDKLNQKLASPVEMQRFRPNLVVTGCQPHAEDDWPAIRIGEIHFRVAKPCSRCIIPTIDRHTAERSAEPLQTLRTYRQRDNKIYFGQNLLHDGAGSLAEGMPVEPLAG